MSVNDTKVYDYEFLFRPSDGKHVLWGLIIDPEANLKDYTTVENYPKRWVVLKVYDYALTRILNNKKEKHLIE